MKIHSREHDLPLRSKGYEVICPNCNADYANEGFDGKHTVTCPDCHFTWHVDNSGRPESVSTHKESDIVLL